MEADDFYALRPVVFFYDAESNHVACAFLELLSDEDKEKYDTILNGEQDAVALGDDGSPTSGGNSVLPAGFAVGVIAAVAGALFLSV